MARTNRSWVFLLCLPAVAGCRSEGESTGIGDVIFSELMYHPVLENADDENHEFVEIYNRGKGTVALGGWRLSSGGRNGIGFAFPTGTRIKAGQYRVIAKNRQMLASVAAYGLQEPDLLGDYTGELRNGGATVTLENSMGVVADAVTYDDKRPWPVSADALGVSDDWLAEADLPLSKHQYLGRSLERISAGADSGAVANWDASALDGATPGKRNSVAGTPVPIVESLSAAPQGGAGAIIRSNQSVVITAGFSALSEVPPPASVEVEYFVDDVTRSGIATTTLAMAPGESGRWTAVLPPQPDQSVVRYRIHAVRGDDKRVAAPRPTEPVSWYAYFVSPLIYVKPGVETKERTYHLFVRPDDWTKLEVWLAEGRAVGKNQCDDNPNWRATVPATFVSDGQVYDVRVRYEGSRFQRMYGGAITDWKYPGPTIARPAASRSYRLGNQLLALSWHIKFPHYAPFEGRLGKLSLNKMSQGCPGTASYVESKLLEKAGIPSYQVDFGRLHINGGYYHYMALMESIDDSFIQRVYPDETVIGELFKDDGVEDVGPFARGDFLPIVPTKLCPKYSVLDRYQYTYPRQNYEHRTYDELIKLIDDLTAARAAGPDAVRAYFMQYWDWQSLLTIFVIRNWSGAWDDTHHNMYPFKRPSTTKWLAVQQDFEWDFGLGRICYQPTLAPFDPNETIYLGWQSTDPRISMQCELSYPAPCNALGFSMLKDAFIGAFKKEYDARMWELTRSPTGVLSTESVSRIIDEAVAKFSMDDWLADPSRKMCNVQSSNADMYTWARLRNATVDRTLAPPGIDARPPPDAGPPVDSGAPMDWTRCHGGDQPAVSAADFCSTYERTCGFRVGDSALTRFTSQAECLSTYGASARPGCLAGQLCYAINFEKFNDSYCASAAAATPPCIRVADFDSGVP